ncbi:MAG: TIGR02147 family protein [Bdellovibrionota bacterium]
MTLQPQSQYEIRQLLFKELERVRLLNQSFSLRAFARKLKLAPSALSEMISGKRAISPKVAARLADQLGWAPDVRDRALQTAGKGRRYQAPRETTQLDIDQFQAISEWYHFAILSLAETKDFKSDAAWIAQRFGISEKECNEALDRLVRLNLLAIDGAGNFTLTHARYTTTDDISNIALRKSHAKNLELAKASLDSDPVERRDFTAITMAADPRKLQEAKRMVREFREELSAFLEDGEKTEVFKFCMQLFPLTKSEEQS